MKEVAALAAGLATASLMVAQVANAKASTQSTPTSANVVFVQTDELDGNHVAVYDRANDGTLSPAGTYATGGRGGAAPGAVVDKLASQGSLVYDAQDSLLFAVNAGSDSFSVFAVDGDTLSLQDVLPSGVSSPTASPCTAGSCTSSTLVAPALSRATESTGIPCMQLMAPTDRSTSETPIPLRFSLHPGRSVSPRTAAA